VGHAFQDGTTVDLSTWNPAKANNLFAGHTACTRSYWKCPIEN